VYEKTGFTKIEGGSRKRKKPVKKVQFFITAIANSNKTEQLQQNRKTRSGLKTVQIRSKNGMELVKKRSTFSIDYPPDTLKIEGS
jgi:hypothetical protein